MKELCDINMENPSPIELRQIDAAIAEHLFGEPVFWKDGEVFNAHSDQGFGAIKVKHYCTPVYVFVITGRMCLRDWNFEIGSDNQGRIYADFTITAACNTEYAAICTFHHRSPSAPVSVCIAALRALEVLPS